MPLDTLLVILFVGMAFGYVLWSVLRSRKSCGSGCGCATHCGSRRLPGDEE